MITSGVFFLSLSSISFEVLLTRIFAISQWNHLSFIVISIALFGFALSGTFLSIIDTKDKEWINKFSHKGPLFAIVCLYSLTAVLSLIIVNSVPLDYFRLPLEPVQSIFLLIDYLTLSMPFFFAGLIISIAYSLNPAKTSLIYFTSMAGSALGAILPALFIPILGENRLVIFVSIIPVSLITALFYKRHQHHTDSHFLKLKPLVLQSIMIILLFFLAFFCPEGFIPMQVKPSPYKQLSRTLLFPDTSITETSNTIKGRIDRIKSPYIRFAPGLSLKFKGILPEQKAVFRDADHQFVLYDILPHKNTAFSSFTLPYCGYLLNKSPEHVLLIQDGGGSAIPCAIESNAKEITIIEQSHKIANILEQHYNLRVISQNPRAFLTRSGEKFDIIHVENWGSSLIGSSALNQEYHFTRNAFKHYLTRLKKDGIIIISRKILLPPSDSLRLWASAYEALRASNAEKPYKHMAILRNWDVFTLIVSARPLEKIGVIKNFASALNFDIVYLPEMEQGEANTFNVFNEPYHYLEINRLKQHYSNGSEKDFFKKYPLDITPQSDNRPFPGRVFKWTRLGELYKSTGSRLWSLLLSGEIVVAATFMEAFIVAVFLLLVPLSIIPKTGLRPTLFQIIYFLSVGFGFIFVEMFFIKEFTLLFGDPVISFTIVLTGILISSALGGYTSSQCNRASLKLIFISLLILLATLSLSQGFISQQILKAPFILRLTLALLILAPTGFLMGFPFPLGMRYMLNSTVQRAYAWSANGCASVLTSIISAQMAISFGIHIILACAIFAYFLAFLSSRKYYSV
jgi:hypothetical protein